MSKNRGAIEGRKSHRLGKEMPINVIYWLTKIAKLLQIWAVRLNMIMAGIKVWITSLNSHFTHLRPQHKIWELILNSRSVD